MKNQNHKHVSKIIANIMNTVFFVGFAYIMVGVFSKDFYLISGGGVLFIGYTIWMIGVEQMDKKEITAELEECLRYINSNKHRLIKDGFDNREMISYILAILKILKGLLGNQTDK